VINIFFFIKSRPFSVVCPFVIPEIGRLPLTGILLVEMLTDQILVECLNTKAGSIGNARKAVYDQGIVDAKGKIVFSHTSYVQGGEVELFEAVKKSVRK
jgi:hypothetical protein